MLAKKSLLLVVFSLMTILPKAQDYVDLGLPSGTLWKNQNEQGHYSHFDAVRNFIDQVPSKEQWMELVNECDWKWTGMGYRIVGPNGNRITLPAEGWSGCDESESEVGSQGDYWSSDPEVSGNAWGLAFHSGNDVIMFKFTLCHRLSVRLVK